MKTEGLKINFLGDSITEGACATVYENCYVKLLENRGIISRNYGIGGTRIARQKAPSTEAVFDRDFCQRFSEMDNDADVVAVFGGTNDFGHGDADFGEFSDTTPDTFYGALHYLYTGLRKKYPNAFIFVITPLHRMGEDNVRGEGNKQIDMPVLEAYVQAIREVAAHYSFPILDLFNDDVLTLANADEFFADGLHPNDMGHMVLAEKIFEYLKNQ